MIEKSPQKGNGLFCDLQPPAPPLITEPQNLKGARQRVPDSNGSVTTGTNDSLTVRTKAHAGDVSQCVPGVSGLRLPVTASQIFTDMSWLPLAIRRPSGLKLTLGTPSVCPTSVRTSSPVDASQILTVLSPLPLTTHRPSGLKARLVTELVCPTSTWPTSPLTHPDDDSLVSTSARNSTTIGAESHIEDLAGVSLPCKGFCSRFGIPEYYGAIEIPAGDPSAVGTEAHAAD